MNKDLRTILDEAPLDSHRALALLKGLARALQNIHGAGDRWDQSEIRVLLADDLSMTSIGSHAEITRRLPPGQIDVHRDFLPPEYSASGSDDFRADFWAWGNVAYEAVTGKSPFAGNSVMKIMTARLKSEAIAPHDVNPQCDKVLSDIISRALRKDPTHRFQSAKELLEALEKVPS